NTLNPPPMPDPTTMDLFMTDELEDVLSPTEVEIYHSAGDISITDLEYPSRTIHSVLQSHEEMNPSPITLQQPAPLRSSAPSSPPTLFTRLLTVIQFAPFCLWSNAVLILALWPMSTYTAPNHSRDHDASIEGTSDEPKSALATLLE
ncbi:hypothetical protein BGZ81_003175, partial [Podila clonocystis]